MMMKRRRVGGGLPGGGPAVRGPRRRQVAGVQSWSGIGLDDGRRIGLHNGRQNRLHNVRRAVHLADALMRHRRRYALHNVPHTGQRGLMDNRWCSIASMQQWTCLQIAWTGSGHSEQSRQHHLWADSWRIVNGEGVSSQVSDLDLPI